MFITQAISELGITEWILRGEPTNEAEFNEMFAKVVGVDETGSAIESTNPEDFGVTWAQVKAKSDELVAAAPLKALREERNRRIAETDWWASSDLTMTAEQSAYRQALRDITETYASLQGVVWPTKP
jgi:hypothetical protein